MAAADAMELGGTFSVPASQIKILMAGGIPTTPEMPGDTEDDTRALEGGLSGLTDNDVVLAISASGSTPYTLAAAGIARAAGACVIAIANNQGAALFALADHVICLPTPPEVLSGSTRMGAGTAQKITLNMLSTLMAGELGHVHDGMMVNLRADNIKLRERAAGIVCRVTGATEATAMAALNATGGDVKTAALIAAGAPSPNHAKTLLEDTAGHLRPALEKLKRAEI
jgi:N-acetylmuramic acid 6-phosphate etherase